MTALKAKAAWVDAQAALDKLRDEAYDFEEWKKLLRTCKRIKKICDDIIEEIEECNSEGDG